MERSSSNGRRRGRPRSARAAAAVVVPLKLRLYPGEDDDLIAFFEGLPAGLRAAGVKSALRSGQLDSGAVGPAEDELVDALDALMW